MKRKTYIVDKFQGQNSKDAPELLPVGEMQTIQGGFINIDGSFDGDQVGTAAVKTGFSHEPIIIHEWKSSDGHEYIFTWGIESGLGVVNYYNKTSAGAVNTTFLTAMPQSYPPELVNWGNEYVVLLGGKYGNYQITSSGGTLTATATTDIPGANFGRINAGALYLAQETSIIHSAINNPLRFTPTREELLAGVYDLNNRLILSSAGVQGETMGYEIWKGYHILWTQYDMYVAAWDGAGTAYATKLPGYGLYGLRGWTCLDDRLLFYSTYKQGSACYLVTGTVGDNGETFTIGQNISVSVVEAPASKKISDILKACPKPTSGKKIIAVDSKEDWDGTKISTDLSATGWDTDTNPGWVSLQGAAKLTMVPQATTGTVLAAGGKTLADFMTLSETASDYDQDGKPGPYPATTGPTSHVITSVLAANVKITELKAQDIWLQKLDGTAVQFTDKDRLANNLVYATGWTSYILNEPILATAITINWTARYTHIPTGISKDVIIQRKYLCPGATAVNIQKMYIYNAVNDIASVGYGTAATYTYTLGEVEVWGFTASTGVITTGPSATASLSVPGLAAGTTDLGLFQIGYRGTDDDGTGGLTGTGAPTSVEVGIGVTTNPADWGTIDVPTANGSISYMTAAELKTGMKLSRLITGLFTFAAGGTLYVRARVPVTLQAGSFASPMIDRLVWDFTTGSARTSCLPLFTWQGKTILSLMTNSSSTECDQAIAFSENGGAAVFDNVKWMAGCVDPDETFVTAGKTIGKLGEGTDNLLWDGSASTDTPTLKTLTAPKIKGINKLFARGIKFGISKYTAEASGNLFDYPDGVTLLHFDGVNESTTITDESGKVWTSYGAKITTAQSVFGGASLDCLNQYVACDAYSADFDFGANPFTISARMRIPATDTSVVVLFNNYTDANNQFDFTYYDDKTFKLVIKKAGVTKASYSWAFPSVAINTWYHVELVRNGADLYCFVNGSALTATVTTAIGTNDITIAGSPIAGIGIGDVAHSCFIDEFLCLKGTALHTATFTSPTAAYDYTPTSQNYTITDAGETTLNSDGTVNTTGYNYLHLRCNARENIYNGSEYTNVYKVPDYRFIVKAYQGATLKGTFYFTVTKPLYVYQDILIDISGLTATTGLTFKISQDRSDTHTVYVTVNEYFRLIAYPLQIAITADGTEAVVYTHPTDITQLTYIPERNQDLRLIQGNTLQAKLTTKGQIKCVGFGMEYDEQEGSL